MRLIDADALTDYLKCLLPARGMWEIEGDTAKDAICETVAEAIEMVKNMETIKPETNCSEIPSSSDCISRQAAINEIDEWIKAFLENGHKESAADARLIQDGIIQLPSAQPEPNTGHWVSQRGGGYCCSECGRYALDEVDGNFIHVAFKSNFCPYCGADMRTKETDYDYERAVEQLEHDILYEPTFNQDDGSM